MASQPKRPQLEYMFISHHQNAGQNNNLMTANKSSENVAKYKHLCIHEEIKSRLSMENACYYSVQNLLSSHLLSKN
jgi:hypothetical protein